jgi:hypothetical protein
MSCCGLWERIPKVEDMDNKACVKVDVVRVNVTVGGY